MGALVLVHVSFKMDDENIFTQALEAWHKEDEVLVMKSGELLQASLPGVEYANTLTRKIDGRERYFEMRMMGLRNMHLRVWVEAPWSPGGSS